MQHINVNIIVLYYYVMASSQGEQTLQEDELQVIIAIFDKVIDLREKDVWKVN